MKSFFKFSLITVLSLLLFAAVAVPVKATLGGPIDNTFDANNFTANNSMTWTVSSQNHYRFDQEGQLLWLSFKVGGTVGGTPSTKLQVKLPNGLHSKNAVSFPVIVNSYGTGWQWGFGDVAVGGSVINFQLSQPSTFSNWGAGPAEVDFVGTIEVQ
jgi:hypothetical protein